MIALILGEPSTGKSRRAEDLTLDVDQLKAVSNKFDYKVEVSDEDIAGLNDTIEFLVSIGVLTEAFDFTPYVNAMIQ